jgi:hypothetical protein
MPLTFVCNLPTVGVCFGQARAFKVQLHRRLCRVTLRLKSTSPVITVAAECIAGVLGYDVWQHRPSDKLSLTIALCADRTDPTHVSTFPEHRKRARLIKNPLTRSMICNAGRRMLETFLDQRTIPVEFIVSTNIASPISLSSAHVNRQWQRDVSRSSASHTLNHSLGCKRPYPSCVYESVQNAHCQTIRSGH